MTSKEAIHKIDLTIKYGSMTQAEINSYLEYKNIIEKDSDMLEQYKNIEKELGIDLITLCKTFEEDIYIKPNNKIIFVMYDKKEFRFYEGNINCNTDDGNFTVSIDDYGKTWALTREELL